MNRGLKAASVDVVVKVISFVTLRDPMNRGLKVTQPWPMPPGLVGHIERPDEQGTESEFTHVVCLLL